MLSSNVEIRGSVWGFWGTFLLGIVLFIAFILGQVLPLLGYMFFQEMSITAETFNTLADSATSDSFLLFLSAMGGMLLAVPVAFGLAKLKKGSILKDYLLYHLLFLQSLQTRQHHQ